MEYYKNYLSNDSNSEQWFANSSDNELNNESEDTLNDISVNYNNNNYYNTKSESNTKDVIIYETNCNSFDTNIDVLDINDYEIKIKRLSEENSKLNQQLIECEEQITDLLSDKKCFEKSTEIRIESFKQKIDSFVNTIEELKQNILRLETINCEVEGNLYHKNKEMEKLKAFSLQNEDKLRHTEFQLSEAKRRESDLRLSLSVANRALNEEKYAKYEAIERLNQLSINCINRDKHIIELNSRMESLKRDISDKNNELWFCRSGDRTSIGHNSESNKQKKTKKISENSVIVHRIKRSKSSDKSTKYSDSSSMNQMEDQFYEKLSDIKTDSNTKQEKNTEEREASVPLDEEIKNLNSSSKSPFFPSLPDVILRKLQLLRENCCSLESLTEEEVESKFATLSISFKTDKLTLDKRVSLYKHQRDVAELDADNELKSLREYIKHLNKMIFSSDDLILTNMRTEIKELLNKIETQIGVIGQTNAKISSRCELFGAVKQEERVSSSFDVILLHSENLKRAKDKELKELEKTKKLLNLSDKKTDLESDSDNETVPLRRSIRSISTTVIPKMNSIVGRRASVSSIEILSNSNSEISRKSVQPNISPKYVTTSPYLQNRLRRCSMPATPLMYRSRNGTDEVSHLEITAEERCGSDSDCASSVNHDSDEEQTSLSRVHLKLSEEIENSSNISEQNNNSVNALNNNKKNNGIPEVMSHRSNQENNERISDKFREEDIKNDESIETNEENQKKISLNLIELNYFVNLIRFCFEGRVGSYIKRIARDFRFILAIILLVSAFLIVIWSLIPMSFPCECRCTYSGNYFIHQFFNLNSKLSQNH